MQVYPKESLGIEVVPVRVGFCVDQKLTFEDQHKDKLNKERERNGTDNLNTSFDDYFGNLNNVYSASMQNSTNPNNTPKGNNKNSSK